MNEGDQAPYTGVLVPISVWDHYQERDMRYKFLEDRSKEIESFKKNDYSGLFLLAGIAIGVIGISAANSQHQIAIAFLGGAALGLTLDWAID